MIKFNEIEIKLAKDYINGRYNDTQFNYIISTKKLNKKNIELLISTISIFEPFHAFSWVMILFFTINIIICSLYPLLIYVN